ncbi:hypothetical protein ANO11243_011790 [Dothideomycetidae sp. 11243]|nr:hypothetical protein ANO11243_011790 [fungal sp. No.11243]
MLPTPSTSHVDYDRVYEPAEDSYLLLDTLSSSDESSFLSAHFSTAPSPLICEVGTGSGVVLAFVAAQSSSILGRSDVLSLGVDLNTFACKATSQTVRTALLESQSTSTFLAATNADLTSSLRDGAVDILIFNPPYVPAPLPDATLRFDDAALSSQQAFERDSHLLALSYAGGEAGMEVTQRLLDEVPRVLSGRGVAYVLLCAQNRPDQVMQAIRGWSGGGGGCWAADIVGRSGKQAGWEKLVVLRIWRPVS